MIQHIENNEEGLIARSKLNEVIDLANQVPNKVERLTTAQNGNVAVWQDGNLIDGGVNAGGGVDVNIPDWVDVQGDPLPLGFVVRSSGRLWVSKVEDNQNNQPPIDSEVDENDYWIVTSESEASGTPIWYPGLYKTQLAEVFVLNTGDNKYYKYILRATVPYVSSDFETELLAGVWQSSSGTTTAVLCDQSDVETASPTENTKFTSALRAFQGFIYWIKNSTISQLQTTAKTIVGAINELLVKLNLKQSVNVGICESCPILSSDVTRDWSTRTLTINTINGGNALSASNPIRFFTNTLGVRSKWEKDTPQSVQWSDTKGLKYIYFDTDGVLKSSDTVWTIGDVALVWRLYWNPSEVGARRIVREAIETHPNTISAADHKWKHRYGAVWMSGFNLVCNILPSGAPSATGLNTCLSFTGGSCMDDNLLYTVANSTTPADFNQDLGITTAASITTTNSAVMDITYNAPDGTLTIIDGTRFPFHAIAGVPQIITAGGIVTPVTNGYFFNYYIYSFQDPRFGKAINLRSGLAYATKAEADAETWETIKAASPTLQDGEVKQLYKTTWEYRTSYDAAINKAALRGSVDLRSNAALSATIGGGSGASIASNVSVTPPSGFVSTNQQDLDNEFAAAIGYTNPALVVTAGAIVVNFENDKVYQPYQIIDTFQIQKGNTVNKIGKIVHLCLIADGVTGHKPTFTSDFNIQYDNWNNANGVKNIITMKILNLSAKILTEIRTE